MRRGLGIAIPVSVLIVLAFVPKLSLEIPVPRDRFYRMWEYFFTSFASAFKTRRLQLWQIVMSKGTIPAYASIR